MTRAIETQIDDLIGPAEFGSDELALPSRCSTTMIGSRADAVAAAFRLDVPPDGAVGVWRWELNRDRVAFSGRAIQLLGETCGHVPSHAPLFLSHMPPEDRMQMIQGIVDVLHGAPGFSVDVTLEGPKGSVRLGLTARSAPGNGHWLIGTIAVR